jgi:hypothetical protein
MTTTAPYPAPRRPPVVGPRVELARYTISAGERILYGQRVNGVARFLPGEPVVLVRARASTEDGTCRSRRGGLSDGRPYVVRHKRRNAEARLPNTGEASWAQ